MNAFLPFLGWLVVLGYALSFAGYVSYFRAKRSRTAAWTRKALLTSVLVHTGYLALLTREMGHLPVGDLFKVLTATSWFFVVVYLILEMRLKEVTMGVFFLPLVTVLQVISNLFIDLEKPLAPVLTDVLFEVHVALTISAYAAFSISFISSVMYILLSREIQSKKLGIFFERLPSLQFFEDLNNHAVNIGLILVSAGILLGVYMGINVWEGAWALDPKPLAVVITWCIYFALFVGRKSVGWQGRRSAIVSVIAYNWLLFSFLVVSIFFSKFHSF